MSELQKIDCHTHIVNREIYSQYCRSSGCGDYALVMEFLPHMAKENMPDKSWSLCDGSERLFLCPSVDIHGDIPKQLKEIEKKMLAHPGSRVVGLKIFLTYQAGRADDERMSPIYDFAEKHGFSVTFHTGLPSLHLPNDYDMDGSNARYVKNVALKYPAVNFIVAHMDDPRYDACLQLMHDVPNMFTDFSGAFEPGTKVAEDEEGTIAEFSHAIHQFPDSYKQIIYGTDFCPPILLSEIEKYDDTIKKIFEEKQFRDIYWHTPLRAYPKVAEYLKKKG
ncbi:amidohydrolase family protein [Anaerofilum sp. BX8]|uniref:Amidohydrolase family protein n=1 Tax=Anaerofilum hominis TaxID=2763016 RepID=A0A923ICB9_9FIRM|nr:amidohydrolase family protein [Anaerofilum hominis]MBC5580275.1 amidohydrolase family protein [Anaerofilum hominis]